MSTDQSECSSDCSEASESNASTSDSYASDGEDDTSMDEHQWNNGYTPHTGSGYARERFTIYTCRQCGHVFRHYYNREPDIVKARQKEKAAGPCPRSQPVAPSYESFNRKTNKWERSDKSPILDLTDDNTLVAIEDLPYSVSPEASD